MQVVWALSVQVERCVKAGVDYDAKEQSQSRRQKRISSVQATEEGQGVAAADVRSLPIGFKPSTAYTDSSIMSAHER